MYVPNGVIPKFWNTNKSLTHGYLGDQIAPSDYHNDSIWGKLIFTVGGVSLLAFIFEDSGFFARTLAGDSDSTFQPAMNTWNRPDRQHDNSLKKSVLRDGGSHEYFHVPGAWLFKPNQFSPVGVFGSIMATVGLWEEPDADWREKEADSHH